MKKYILFYFLFIIINSFSQLPKDIVWQKTYKTSEDDRVIDLLETDDSLIEEEPVEAELDTISQLIGN